MNVPVLGRLVVKGSTLKLAAHKYTSASNKFPSGPLPSQLSVIPVNFLINCPFLLKMLKPVNKSGEKTVKC